MAGNLGEKMLKTVRLHRPFRHDGGAAFISRLPQGGTKPGHIFLMEDGVGIGSADAKHQDIRDLGKGRYSLWNNAVHFSASDNSNCNKNGREYQIIIMDHEAIEEVRKGIEKDSDAVLRIMAGSTNYTNSLIPNFFEYYNGIKHRLDRNGIALPKSVLEVGSGAKPLTAIRFLLEGVERYVANDLFEIQSAFTPSFVESLRTVCTAIGVPPRARFDQVMKRDGDIYRVAGLQTIGGRSFETLNESETFDFIHSTSVLEHVRNPLNIAKRMADLLRPGGFMFHSIDFRDHRGFDKPFEFLKLTEHEYAPIWTENRLRSSDWIEILDSCGFDIIDRVDAKALPGGRSTFVEEVEPFITEAMRSEFAEPFKSKDLTDLSIVCTQVVCRKR